MSGDKLTDRLRGKYKIGPDGLYGTRDMSGFTPPICAEAADEIERLQGEAAATQKEATVLALALWGTFYREKSPDFKLSDSVAGIISQIDNMVAGLTEDLAHMATQVQLAEQVFEQNLELQSKLARYKGIRMRECNSCDWVGPLITAVTLGGVGPLCPECRETTCEVSE